jgi:lysyl-tRNA synthetase class 2
MSEADVRAERLKKLDRLKEAGMPAYPARSERDTTNAGVAAQFAELESSGKTLHVGGRVMSLRGQGGIAFADLFDGTAKLQVVLQKADMDEALFDLFSSTVDVGDFIEVTGVAFTTKRGEHSVKATAWRMLSKSLLPLPDSWYGLKDEEKILRERYLDILMNPEVRAMFERRAKFWKTIRDFYIARGFIEVETPVLESSPGGADARPFTTHHNALDLDVSLRISLELWLKRLLVAGFPKVFEIGRIFRNEGQSREHAQDYAQWESYEAYSDMTKGMEFIKELYRTIAKEVYGKYTFEIGDHTVDLADEWQQLDYCALVTQRFGVDPLTCTEEEAIRAVHDAKIPVGETLNKTRAIDHLWKAIRKGITGPAFLLNQPEYLEPLAKRSEKDPRIVERMQIILAGSEVGKGFSELNDPLDQKNRFEEQQKLRDEGDDEAQRLDEEYVRAMEYGMPPSFGFGMSERLFSFLENRPIHVAQLFPLLRPRQAE